MGNVNRNEAGYVDFEKFAGLDGIALVNIVANAAEATLSGRKALQTRITHNDGERFGYQWDLGVSMNESVGGSWKPLAPPKLDSQGRAYPCSTTVRRVHFPS